MSVLRRASEQRSISYQDVWGRGLDWSPAVAAGQTVNATTVTSLDAVAACLGLGIDLVTMLPVDVYRDKAGTADPLTTAPSIVADPSGVVDAETWRAQLWVSWALWGNAYGIATGVDPGGRPTGVEWIDPAQVVPEQTSVFRRPTFRVNGQVMDPETFVHLPGRFVFPGSALGVAPLERFRETFGLALAARQYGSSWFAGGGHPTAVVTSKKVVDEDQAKAIKSRVMSVLRSKKREPLVLGDDTTYQPIQATAAESQFNETQDRQVVAVARAFGFPAEMIGAAVSGSSVTYANREQRAIDFLTFSADPWLVRFERMWGRWLPSPQYAKFNRGALLRSDISTRYNTHDKAIRAGFGSVNERRALEDLPPIDGGDEFLWPPYRAFPLEEDSQP